MNIFSVSETVTSMGLPYDIFQRSLKGLSQLYLPHRWAMEVEAQNPRVTELGMDAQIYRALKFIFATTYQPYSDQSFR